MNLLIVTPAFYPATYYGGPIFSLYSSTLYLAKNGYTVFVSTTNCNGKNKLDVEVNKFLELKKNLFVKYYSGGTESGFSILMYLLLWQDIIAKDIIYLVSIFSPPTPLVIFLNMFFRKPLILSPRGQLGEWSLKQGNILKKLWLKIFIKPIANKITWEATSVSEKEMIKKVYPEARVEVIPPIINLKEFQPEADQPLADEVQSSESNHLDVKTPDVEKQEERRYEIYKKLVGPVLSPTSRGELKAQKIIVSMGRLHKVKGFDILIEAMKIVKDQVKVEDCVLLIAGEDFGERKNLEQLIDKLGLKEKVFLVGNIEGSDKIEFLRNADVFALASHHENFGIVYAEALASGLPVIASRNTPWQDVEKYNCGKWVENTSEEFAKSILNLLNSDVPQMGVKARNFIKENFSMGLVVRKYEALFKSVLGSE